jgi:hypothetical protein
VLTKTVSIRPLFFVLPLQYNSSMKTATIPPIRVEPSFRLELEGVLGQGESLSEFVENAVRSTVQMRKTQAEFVQRGITAIAETKRVGGGISAEVVIAKLEAKLASARRSKAQSS